MSTHHSSSQVIPTQHTMNNTHPIELFIASLLYLVEGICYIINEIAGHHQEEITDTTIDTKSPKDLGSASVHSLTTTNTEVASSDAYIEYVYSLTIKQLQQLTGIRSSRYRKADLQLLAITT